MKVRYEDRYGDTVSGDLSDAIRARFKEGCDDGKFEAIESRIARSSDMLADLINLLVDKGILSFEDVSRAIYPPVVVENDE